MIGRTILNELDSAPGSPAKMPHSKNEKGHPSVPESSVSPFKKNPIGSSTFNTILMDSVDP